jgi:death-on-curing protein
MDLVLITREEVLQLHAEGIRRWGGKRSSTRSDSGDCIEGRIGNAANAEAYATDDERIRQGLCFAGFLLFYLASDHCFTDGNKRVAWMAAMHVLADQGLTIEATEDETYAFMDAVARGDIKRGQEVVRWLAERLSAPEI